MVENLKQHDGTKNASRYHANMSKYIMYVHYCTELEFIHVPCHSLTKVWHGLYTVYNSKIYYS